MIEFEVLWQDIVKIKKSQIPCTMDSFDQICDLLHLITQFYVENTPDAKYLVFLRKLLQNPGFESRK